MQGEAIKRIQHCCISSDTDSQKSFPRRVSAVNCVGELTFANIHPPETKCQDSDFPLAELEQLGYHVAKAGQKSYNGEGRCVAVCCSVLQCVAVCCSVLQCVAVCCSVLQGVEGRCAHRCECLHVCICVCATGYNNYMCAYVYVQLAMM